MIFIPLIPTLSTFSFSFLPPNFSLSSSPNSIITQQSPSTKTSHHSRFIFHPTSPNILRHSKYLQCISTRSRESSSITRPCDSVDFSLLTPPTEVVLLFPPLLLLLLLPSLSRRR